jgi:hypothetical protein
MESTVQRSYSAPPAELFAAAVRTALALGYTVVEFDPCDQQIVVALPGSVQSPAETVTLSVRSDARGSQVVLTTAARPSPAVGRGRLAPPTDGRQSRRFLDGLARDLSVPSPGWFPDPSGRFAYRWWEGSAWGSWAYDRPGGPQFEDAPGALPRPRLGAFAVA